MSNLTKTLLPSLERLLTMADELEDEAHKLGLYMGHFHYIARHGDAKIEGTKLTASMLWTHAGICEARMDAILRELEEFRVLYHQQNLRAFEGGEIDEEDE